MDLLYYLKKDFGEMIELARMKGALETEFNYVGNTLDRRNYSKEKGLLINKKIKEIDEMLEKLILKWGI